MIRVSNLRYAYNPKADPVLKGLEFHLEKGEIFGFLGPSGAGKSTTQNILIGLIRGFQGKAEILGKDVSRWGRGLYTKIGVGFELPRFYQRFTALENLNFFSRLYPGKGRDPLELMEKFGLKDQGHKQVSQFSKGMKTRLGLCRALIHHPELLFLDEPTTGLDPATSKMVRNNIKDLKDQGCSIFLTTHSMESALDLCDRVAFLHQGEIVECGHPQELMEKYGKREVTLEFLGNQKREKRSFPMDNLGANQDFLQLLKNRSVQSIHSQESSLEEIFIQLTGKGLNP